MTGLTRRAVAIVVALLLVPLAIAFFLVRALVPGPPSRLPAPASSSEASATPAPTPTRPAEDRSPEIRGRIFDAEGNAVRGAAVRLVTPSPPYRVLRDAISDREGFFSFAHVAPRRACVDVDHDPEGFAHSAELRANEGRVTDVTLVLSATSGVRGTVLDGERPVAGATLSVEGVPWGVPSTTSDDAGAFHLSIVPVEATGLVAVARGYRAAHVALPHREDHGEVVVRIRLTGAPPVEGDVTGIDGEPIRAQVVACAGQPSEARTTSAEDGTFSFPPSVIGCEVFAELADYAPSEPSTASGAGRVTLRLKAGGSIAGVVVDDRGSGVPSFDIGIESYTSPRHRNLEGGGPRGFEDTRGAFQWDKLAPGTYVLTASTSGRPPARSSPIEVAGGAATRGVRIVLAQGGSLSGTVYDESHTPLKDVDVGFDSVSSVIASSATARTDERGRYKLDGAPAGPLTLRVQKSGFRMRLVSGLRVSSGRTLTEDITLVAGAQGMNLSGIGATLRLTDDGIELASVGADEPAERAGLLGGDRVLTIDGESSEGMSVADVVQRLRGQAGSNVEVSVLRAGESLDVTIERAEIVR